MPPQHAATRELLTALKEIIRLAVLTLGAVRDPDARFLGWATLPATVVRDAQEAYGYAPVRLRFVPSPADISQMEIILPMLAWLRREEGDQALRRIMAWALGASIWRLAGRERCSDQTILNRIDRSVAAIIRQFAAVDIVIERTEDTTAGDSPELSPRHGRVNGSKFALVIEKPPGPHGEVRLMKVYAGGAFWIGGKRWRDGRDKIPEKATA